MFHNPYSKAPSRYAEKSAVLHRDTPKPDPERPPPGAIVLDLARDPRYTTMRQQDPTGKYGLMHLEQRTPWWLDLRNGRYKKPRPDKNKGHMSGSLQATLTGLFGSPQLIEAWHRLYRDPSHPANAPIPEELKTETMREAEGRQNEHMAWGTRTEIHGLASMAHILETELGWKDVRLYETTLAPVDLPPRLYALAKKTLIETHEFVKEEEWNDDVHGVIVREMLMDSPDGHGTAIIDGVFTRFVIELKGPLAHRQTKLYDEAKYYYYGQQQLHLLSLQ